MHAVSQLMTADMWPSATTLNVRVSALFLKLVLFCVNIFKRRIPHKWSVTGLMSKQLMSLISAAGWEHSVQGKSSWEISWAHEGGWPGRGSSTYLNVGRVALTPLPVDVQAQLLAQLAGLSSSLGEVNPGRLGLLSLIYICSQVEQQLWGEAETNHVKRRRKSREALEARSVLVPSIKSKRDETSEWEEEQIRKVVKWKQ